MNKLTQYNRQRGTILLVALVLLLVMTIVGVATMESSTLQERMASNDRQRTISLNAAEVALRAGEQWLLDNVQSTFNLQEFDGTNGRYSAVPRPGGIGGVVPLPAAVDIEDASDWVALGTEVNGLDPNIVVRPPRYIIEYLGRVPLSVKARVDSLNAGVGGGDVTPYIFRVTAIGWSRDANIYTVLESSFRTGTGDGVFSY